MVRRHWFFILPAVLLIGLAGRTMLNPVTTRGSDGRIVDVQFLNLEKRLGYPLLAPTWLPHGGRVGEVGAIMGARRILQDFTDDKSRSLLIMSQERRNDERDRYHERIFHKRADAVVEIDGERGYLVTGSSGERRLFWNEPEMAVILSSCVLTDQEMVEVARKVR